MECKKKTFTKKDAIKYLAYLKRRGYGKKPWRDEISYYRCDDCGKWHVSSKKGDTLIKKPFFEHQRDKWKEWLFKYSDKKGRL